MNTAIQTEPDEVMSDAVADAWAEVFIDIYERLEAEGAAKLDETTEPPRMGPRVAVDQGSIGGDPISSLNHEE